MSASRNPLTSVPHVDYIMDFPWSLENQVPLSADICANGNTDSTWDSVRVPFEIFLNLTLTGWSKSHLNGYRYNLIRSSLICISCATVSDIFILCVFWLTFKKLLLQVFASDFGRFCLCIDVITMFAVFISRLLFLHDFISSEKRKWKKKSFRIDNLS